MNLLIVGNGFDLAHKVTTESMSSNTLQVHLPTKYSDFLDFMVLCINSMWNGEMDNNWRHWGCWDEIESKKPREMESPYALVISAIYNILEKINSNDNISNVIVKNIFNDNIDLISKKINKNILRDNEWLKYLLCIYSYKKSLENPSYMWIDIEDEIQKLLIRLQSLDKVFDNNFILPIIVPYINGNDKTPKDFYFTTIFERFKRKNNVPEDKIKSELFNILFQDLEQFDFLLKFYLKLVQKTFHREGKKIFNINTNFKNSIIIDRVLSFNYTNISSIYLNENKKSYIHFINGNLKKSSNIILGIENPDKDRLVEFCDNNINLFFKNFQRVLYDMDYKYSYWVREKFTHDEKNLYTIGHSLAYSDQFILLDAMEQSNSVVIYYYNDEDKLNKTTNLYKILGDKKFSQYVNNRSGKPHITLKSQKEIEL